MGKQIKRFKDRKVLEFGDLRYSIYFKTTRITSGIAIMPPNGKGDIDIGHKDAEEVFSVCKGKILITFPNTNKKYMLYQGDALLIPSGVPHVVENKENEEAVFIFSIAPNS